MRLHLMRKLSLIWKGIDPLGRHMDILSEKDTGYHKIAFLLHYTV